MFACDLRGLFWRDRHLKTKRAIARLMRRSPLLYALLLRAVKLVAARFTAGVTGVVFNQAGEILLLEHVFRDRSPWGLPGGWVGRRERPQDALQRELLEEVGLEVRIGPPVVVDLGHFSTHLETSFLCEAESEVHTLSQEILNARWTSPDALPPDIKPFERRVIAEAQKMRTAIGPNGNWTQMNTDNG